MSSTDSFLDAPEGPREEIMCATYRALCEHGYVGLTIQRIGEHFPKSKSLIYHHYDGKDDLLVDFLEFMLEQFEGAMPFEDADGADEHLEAILDHAFETPLPEKRREFTRAMVELRAQAAHDARYREHFSRHDRFFVERIATIVDSGVDSGVFRPVDPQAVATLLVTTINGAMNGFVTTDEDTAATLREEVDAYLRARLLEDG